ncbi:MAG: S8 family serine peptidase [Clostridia bacterium]|nr:S8 family serine peptidase [Clostridia bacterium]
MKKRLVMLCLISLLVIATCIFMEVGTVQAKESLQKETKAEVMSSNIELDIEGFVSKYLTGADVDEVVSTNPDLKFDVIIELDDAAVNAYKGTSDLRDYLISEEGVNRAQKLLVKQNSVMQDICNAGIEAEFVYNFTSVINAIGANVRYGDIDAISAIDGVKRVTLSETYSVPDTTTTEEDIINVGLVNTEYGVTGKGMLIGIIDTGANIYHEVFQVEPENGKLDKDSVASLIPDLIAVNGYQLDYWKDGTSIYDNPYYPDLSINDVYYNQKIPYAFNYGKTEGMGNLQVADNQGHGTHVASTAAGNAGAEEDDFRGVAYDAQLAILKVFSGSGASQLNIIAALQDAIILGCDSINLSLGSPSGFGVDYYNYEYYQAIEDAGIVMNISAGNATTMGYTYGYGDWGNNPMMWNVDFGIIGSPSSYEQSLTVASCEAYKNLVSYFMVGEGKYKYNEIPDTVLTDALLGEETSADYEIVYAGKGTPDELAALDLNGKVALIQRGSLSFSEKFINAQAAGAVACIVFDNVDGALVNMSITMDNPLPGCFISLANGTSILKQIEDGNTTVSFSTEYIFDYGYLMSTFSSWGPLGDLTLKPEITAPGGQIYAAYSESGLTGTDEYTYLSGTSMSTPHMTGVMALVLSVLKDRYPEMSATERRLMAMRLVMSTADIMYNEEGEYTYTPRQQGAGLVNVLDAINAKSYIFVDGQDKTKVELGDDPDNTGIYEFTINVANISADEMVYTPDALVMTQALMSNGFQFDYSTMELGATVTYTVNQEAVTSITVAANTTVAVTVKIVLNANYRAYLASFPCGNYVDGFVKLVNGDNSQSLNVPFLAFLGDWTTAPYVDFSIYDDLSILNSTYNTFLAGYYYGQGTFILGEYAFKLPSDIDGPYPNADKIAIAPENMGGAISELYYSYIGVLRNMRYAYFRISDADTGEVFYEQIYDTIRKTYFNTSYLLYYPDIEYYEWSSYDSKPFYEAGLPNNTRLVYEFGGMPEFELKDGRVNNSMNPTFTTSITIDNELPTLLSEGFDIYKTEEGRVMLTFNITDNHYMMSAWPMQVIIDEKGKASLGEDLCDYLHPIDEDTVGAITTMTYDITDYLHLLDNGYIAIGAYDYALNFNAWATEIELPEMDGPQEMEVYTDAEVYAAGDTFTLNYDLYPINYELGYELKVQYFSEDRDLIIWNEKLQMFEVVGVIGTASIGANVYWIDNDGEMQYLSALTTVEVLSPPSEILVGYDDKIVNDPIELKINEVIQLSVSIPENTYCIFDTIEFVSSNNSFVKVDNDGYLKAYATGQATVTAYATYTNAMGESVTLTKELSVIISEEAVDEITPTAVDVFYNGSSVSGKAISGYYNAEGAIVKFYPGDTIQFNYVFTPWFASQAWTIVAGNAYGTSDYFTINNDMSITCVAATGGTYGLFYLVSKLDSNLKCMFGIVVTAQPVEGGDSINSIGLIKSGDITVNAEGSDPEETPEFEISDGVLVKYNGTATEVTIPAEVTALGSECFVGTNVVKVILHENVVKIGNLAFNNVATLQEINLENVTTIGFMSFSGTSLQVVEFGQNIVLIDDGAFNNVALTEVVFPEALNDLLTIGMFAFNSYEVEDLVLPYGIYSVNYEAFESCYGNIFIPETLVMVDFGLFLMCENCTFTISQNHPTLYTYEDAVIDIYGNYLYYFGEWDETMTIRIPDFVTRIGAYAFYYKDFGAFIVPASVKRIGYGAFANWGLYVIFEGMEAPVLETEMFENDSYFNFGFHTVVYPEGATGYEHWSYTSQLFWQYEGTTDNLLEIYSFNVGKLLDSIGFVLYGEYGIEGVEIYVAKGDAEDKEFELFYTFEEFYYYDTNQYIFEGADYLTTYSFYAVAYMTVDGEKVYGQPTDTIEIVCEPNEAYILDAAILAFKWESLDQKEDFIELYEAVAELDDKQKAYMENLEVLDDLYNQYKAMIVSEAILALPATDLANVRAMYDALTEAQKAYVVAYGKLESLEKIATLTAALTVANDRIGELTARIVELENTIAALETENARLGEIEANLEELKAEAQALKDEAERLNEESKEAYNKIMSCATVGVNGGSGSGLGGGLAVLGLLAILGTALFVRARRVKNN